MSSITSSSLNAEVIIPLEYFSNIWRFFNLPLINIEIQLDLSWTKNCEMIEHHNNITRVNFIITSTTLYVLVLTCYINGNIKFWENIKQGLKRTISRNKYRSEITTLPKHHK